MLRCLRQRPYPLARLSLIAAVVATATGWQAIWGLLFLTWGLRDLLHGRTWLTETVERDSAPLLFYLIVTLWLVFACGILLIETGFQPSWSF